MYYIKFFLTWVTGIIIAGVGISLWKGEAFDWKLMATIGVAGLIGISITAGLKKVKKDVD